MKILKQIFIIFLAILVLQMCPVRAMTKEKTAKFPLGKAEGLVGNYDEFSFGFSCGKDWNIKDAYLELIFTQGFQPVYLGSILEVVLNGEKVYSTNLIDKQLQLYNLKVHLPIDTIVKGENEITIKSYRLIDNKEGKPDTSGQNIIGFDAKTSVYVIYE